MSSASAAAARRASASCSAPSAATAGWRSARRTLRIRDQGPPEAAVRPAAARPEPVPVFAEMGSVNPVFLGPNTLAASGDAIAAGLSGSVCMGTGQFCTSPGLAVLVESDRFEAQMKTAMDAAPRGYLLNPGIRDALKAGLERLRGHGLLNGNFSYGHRTNSAAAGAHLTLSGHTHGGQIALTGLQTSGGSPITGGSGTWADVPFAFADFTSGMRVAFTTQGSGGGSLDLASVTVIGLVVNRQHPASAGGVIFLTLEDETGHANIIVWQDLTQRFHKEVLHARLLEIQGVLQCQDNVIHVVARKLVDHTPLLGELVTPSRDFR